MIVTPTYYKNNSRVISGLSNLVFDNDVVLLCNTSAGAVNLTLLDIPADRFSTQYKIYVVDQSNNAGTNNITITAPIGFTVNNSSTAVINVNGGVAIITISSYTTYNAQFNYNLGGGGAIVVKDEGIVITTNATSFNFIGSNVSATAIGSDVTVNIQSVFILLNYSQLQTLISTNALIPSQQYLISDAIFTNTVLENVPIVVEAITTNEISLNGSGIFLNADYQNVGDYSGVAGFNSQLGIWDSSLAPVVGDVVIWNNLHWVNLTGSNGGSPDLTPIDWSQLAKSNTNGYIQEIDYIKYNVANNQINYREDIRHNRIENNINLWTFTSESFYCFQWGNNSCTNNSVSSESDLVCWNSQGNVTANEVTGTSDVTVIGTGDFLSNEIKNQSVFIANSKNQIGGNYIDGSVVTITANTGKFYYNNITSSTITISSNIGQFYQNLIVNSIITIDLLTDIFRDNNLTVSNIVITTCNQLFAEIIMVEGSFSENSLSQKIVGGIYQQGIGTIIYRIDLNDPTIYDLATLKLTIPTNFRNSIGEFWLFNGGGKTIELIEGLNSKFATRFRNFDGGTLVTFSCPVALGVAPNYGIVSTQPSPVTYRINSIASGWSYITIKQLNLLNGVEEVNIYQ